MQESVLSRHRLPHPYRYLLVGLWLTPLLLLILTIAVGNGVTLAFFDPRFLLLLVFMALPALYIWQEGVDVLAGGIRVRVYVPSYHPYQQLGGWDISQKPPSGEVICIWDHHQQTVLSYHTAHLTDLQNLREALHSHIGQL